MSESDLFLICPVCGMEMDVTYGENQRRPTMLDDGHKLESCPVCGGRLIRIVNPTFDDKWDIRNEVQYTVSQRNKLLATTYKYDESNTAKLKELTNPKKEEEVKE